MINLAIYSIESVDAYRYNFFMFNKLFKNRCSNTISLYVENDINLETLKLFNKYFKNVIVEKVFLYNSNKIKNLIIRDKINFLIINSFTAGDFRILNSIKNHNIFILYIQHGLYLNYMKRNFRYFINNINRVISSLYYIAEISSWNFKNTWDFANVYLSGRTRNTIPQELRSQTSLNLVFSDYWKTFHEEIYKINTEYYITGFLDGLKFNLKTKKGIIYCAQTLVEDGRIDKLTMINFYKELFEFGIKLNSEIIVKIHPRNSIWTQSIFEKYKFKIEKKDIPVGMFTIGHYSSLLPIWAINKSPIIIFELRKHPTPDSIMNVSSLTVKTLKNVDIKQIKILKINNNTIKYFGDYPNVELLNQKIFKLYENTILSAIN